MTVALITIGFGWVLSFIVPIVNSLMNEEYPEWQSSIIMLGMFMVIGGWIGAVASLHNYV